jgi:hypothetical protein
MAPKLKLPPLWSYQKREAALPELTMRELTENFDLLHVGEEAGKQFAIVSRMSGAEIGTSSPSPWTSFTRQEYNTQLQGSRGLEKWDQMRKGDGTVRGTLRLIKTPVFAGRWFVQAEDPLDPLQKEQAEFVWCCFTEYMSIGWHQVLVEALLMCDFGYYMFEDVWENRVVKGELRTVLQKLAPRHPMDVEQWVLDAHGGPKAVRMYTEVTETRPDGVVPIPIEKLLVFSFDREAGNIEGISVLRSAYKHWYFKEQLYKIDAIQKERHGIGIPVIELPLGFSDDDKKSAQNLGRNIRTNESAHAVMPPGWKLYMLKLEGNPVDALKSIEHHNASIRENILVNLFGAGMREEDLGIAMKASRFVADIVAETFNLYLIPKLIDYNWPGTEYYPKLKVRRIGEAADWRTLTFAIRNLVGAGVIIPDEDLEANLRNEMDLPPLNKESARLIATPQNPYDINEDIDEAILDQDLETDERIGEGTTDDPIHNQNNPNYNRNRRKLRRRVKQQGQRAGLPRQATIPNTQNTFGVPRKNSGLDRSGGR